MRCNEPLDVWCSNRIGDEEFLRVASGVGSNLVDGEESNRSEEDRSLDVDSTLTGISPLVR